MNIARVVAAVIVLVVVVGCGAKYVARGQLDETLMWYRTMLEKGDLEATVLLASDSIAQEYRERVRMAREVRVVECRILKIDYAEEAREAAVTMEIDYYSLQTLKARRVSETQKWVYTGDRDSSGWRLVTVLPLLN